MTSLETYIALLYSVVLGPGRRVVMSDLTSMASGSGLLNPRTVLATGNLIFEAKHTPAAELERMLELEFEKSFGKRVDIILRTAAEWKLLLESNPFPEASANDASHVIVRVNREPVPPETIDLLTPYLANGEQFVVSGKDIWIHFARDIGSSKLASAITPKRAGIGTGRNWNTVQKIAAAVERTPAK